MKKEMEKKGKIYKNYDDLYFADEYLNDLEWNGKIYDLDDNIIYDLKNGKKIDNYEVEYLNGKGKEYYKSGELKFEGEYLCGRKHGKGKEYYERGKLKFEGEYLYGRKCGKGKDYDFFLLLDYPLKENIYMEENVE